MKTIIGIIILIVNVCLFASGVTCLVIAAFSSVYDAVFEALLVCGHTFVGIGLGGAMCCLALGLIHDPT